MNMHQGGHFSEVRIKKKICIQTNQQPEKAFPPKVASNVAYAQPSRSNEKVPGAVQTA